MKCPTVSYVPNKCIDADSEPSGIAVRIHVYVSSQFFQIGPFPIISFLGTWSGVAIMRSYENMIIFMLNEVIGELYFISKTENLFQGTIKTHFFSEPSMDSLLDRFIRPGVAAACVCP